MLEPGLLHWSSGKCSLSLGQAVCGPMDRKQYQGNWVLLQGAFSQPLLGCSSEVAELSVLLKMQDSIRLHLSTSHLLRCERR